ncbi:hypothetical protein GGR53DRAFT_469710 [Hypoxylon sp. FL1150]|nr:hypothetical protein GGR53DRAFT_469710 [Hypoxylon sp. FL1150]
MSLGSALDLLVELFSSTPSSSPKPLHYNKLTLAVVRSRQWNLVLPPCGPMTAGDEANPSASPSSIETLLHENEGYAWLRRAMEVELEVRPEKMITIVRLLQVSCEEVDAAITVRLMALVVLLRFNADLKRRLFEFWTTRGFRDVIPEKELTPRDKKQIMERVDNSSIVDLEECIEQLGVKIGRYTRKMKKEKPEVKPEDLDLPPSDDESEV